MRFLFNDGKIVNSEQKPRKTPITHPYSYDPFDIFTTGKKANGSIYTDRLLMWDFDKHDKLCQKHFGNERQGWRDRSPKLIEKFLRDWGEDPKLVLTRIVEYCNLSTGYPTWRLDFYSDLK